MNPTTELGLSPKSHKLIDEMSAADTSPAMRTRFARASLRARGLDLFAAPPVK